MTKHINELTAMNAANARNPRPRKAVPVEEIFGIECPGLPEMGVFSLEAAADREAVPQCDPHYVFRDTPETRRVLRALERPGNSCYLVGPTGCGKTTLIEQACARLGRPVTRVNLDGSLGRGDLVGIWVFKEDQSMSFQHGPITTAIRDGHALILDEIDVANPSVLLLFQACLEGRPFKVLENGETIAPHPDFRLFATANTIGRGEGGLLYRGAQAQNFALLDRFRWFLEIGYPGEEEEIRILRARFGDALPEDVYAKLARTAAEIRLAHETEDCEAPMSTRAVIDIAKDMIEDRCPPRDAFRYRLLNRLGRADREVCEKLMKTVWGRRINRAPDGESAAEDPAIVKQVKDILKFAAHNEEAAIRFALSGGQFALYVQNSRGVFVENRELENDSMVAVIDCVKGMAGLGPLGRKRSQTGILNAAGVVFDVEDEAGANGEERLTLTLKGKG